MHSHLIFWIRHSLLKDRQVMFTPEFHQRVIWLTKNMSNHDKELWFNEVE